MHSRASRRMVWFCLLSAALLPLSMPSGAQVKSTPDRIAKMVSLMKADNYNYQTTNSNAVWVIHFTGDHLKDIKVVLAASDSPDVDFVCFVTVVPKARLPVTTDFMRMLLEQNHNIDRAKIAYDKDGDLSIETEDSLRAIDAQELRSIISHIRDNADFIYGKVEPYLLP